MRRCLWGELRGCTHRLAILQGFDFLLGRCGNQGKPEQVSSGARHGQTGVTGYAKTTRDIQCFETSQELTQARWYTIHVYWRQEIFAYLVRSLSGKYGPHGSGLERAIKMSSNKVALPLDEVKELSVEALLASATIRPNAVAVAESIVAAEADGIHSHGLMRLPTYCDHALCGKVDGTVTPCIVKALSNAITIDARCGFAHPAIALGFSTLIPAARNSGIAGLAVVNSYNCGVLGYHVERLASEGLIGLAFVNTPAAIAPWGGKRALFGTNPIAFAAPRKHDSPLVIDQSSSIVARGEVLLKAKLAQPIPETWGLDSDGKPTLDPKAVLNGGSMAPAGGYKGVAMALMVEVLAAALIGANFSYMASSLINNEGGPPRIGQFFVAIDPSAFVGDSFQDRIESLCTTIANEEGSRLPGERRKAARIRAARDGIQLSRELYDDLMRRARGSSSKRGPRGGTAS